MIIVFVPGDEMALEAQGYRMAMAGEILGEKELHVEIFIVAIPTGSMYGIFTYIWLISEPGDSK